MTQTLCATPFVVPTKVYKLLSTLNVLMLVICSEFEVDIFEVYVTFTGVLLPKANKPLYSR